MHKFAFHLPVEVDAALFAQGAHMVGAEGVPARAVIRAESGLIRAEARASEPAGLSLLWPVAGVGTYQLETTRLPGREEPYCLSLELARHRLMRISIKREEWGLFDYPGMDDVAAEVDAARDKFVEALKADSFAEQSRLGDEALAEAIRASEHVTRFHASVFLGRRGGGVGRGLFGAGVAGAPGSQTVLERSREAIDFLRVPFTWREIQPQENSRKFDATDAWIAAAGKAGLSVRSGPLLNFGVQFVPDWMYIWENDYETIVDMARDQIGQCVRRYAGQVTHWTVASGIHGDNVFSLTFEQIIDLTRMAATVARQTAPRAQIIIDLTQPWGEYYARNQRTIPPPLYAEMAVQSGIPFDAFGLQFVFGLSSEGFHLRDLMQISSMLDRLANFGKVLHVTAVAVPGAGAAKDAYKAVSEGGIWSRPWSESTQAEWLREFCEVALSKPFVESVCVQNLVDGPQNAVPLSGLFRADGTPKAALGRLSELRKRILSEGRR